MDDDKILELTGKIESTLGKENSAMISDTIGEILTGNTANMKAIADRDEEIKKLKEKNEKLVAANGALLQRVPVGFENSSKKKEEKEEPKPINDTTPLWLKKPSECTDEEYKDFYRRVFYRCNDWR
mgnify:CR=1 FL=1